MKITNDPMLGRPAAQSQYDAIFAKLTPEANCLVCEDWKEANRVSQALDSWAKKNIDKACKVRSTRRYKADGLPRVWLIWPEQAKSVVRGNWPKKGA